MAKEMKDSGVKWIGTIPTSWNIQKVKTAFYRSKEEAHIEDPVILSLARSGVKIRDISNNEGQLAESYYNYNPVIEGDLLLNPMDLYSGANCSISKVSGVISPAYINLRTRGNYCPAFYDYYFKTQYWAMALFAHGKGVSFDNRWTLSPNDLFNYYIPVPDFDEQKRIADFLDRKCAEIDTVIEKTKATIEEYKKLKQSVITEAVTKGVRGNRAMKDSGIEWIGDIPAEWEIRKLFRAIDKIGDIDHYMPNSVETGIPYLMTGDLKEKISQVDFDVCKQVSLEDYETLSSKIKATKGDIIFARYATIGTVCIVDIDKDFLVSYSCLTIKPTQSLLIGNFLFYYLKSTAFFEDVKQYINSNTQANVGLDSMTKAKIVLPTLQEQEEIADYLDHKCAEIDKLIADKTHLLEEMESYKKSIIYEYVTGKKEVM